MFDDLKQNSPTVSASNSAGATTSAPRASSGVSDMFDAVDPIAGATSSGPIDSNKPSAVQSGKIRPVSQTNLPANNVPVAVKTSVAIVNHNAKITSAPNIPSEDSILVAEQKSDGPMRKIIIAVLVIILLAGVGAGVYYFLPKANFNKDVSETNQNSNMPVNTNTNNPTDLINGNDNTDILVNEDELDEDFDGLSNGLEKTYGTNPLEADSDNDQVFDQDEIEVYKTDPLADDSDSDNLSDYQEIFVYKTDPNDPDTDGDTFLDGVEVLNGYNPLGVGRLEDNSANSNLNTNTNESL